jgi:hypothetical protein
MGAQRHSSIDRAQCLAVAVRARVARSQTLVAAIYGSSAYSISSYSQIERYQQTYRNHVYRGLTYHQLLGAALPDAATLAWAVHDLGIWTAGSFDYLTPVSRSGVHARRRIRGDGHRACPNDDSGSPQGAPLRTTE